MRDGAVVETAITLTDIILEAVTFAFNSKLTRSAAIKEQTCANFFP